MPQSSPPSPAPIVSSESPPRTSRQRRRRSFSSTVLHPHYPREHRQRPRRPPVVQVSGSIVCTLRARLLPQLPDLLAHRAQLGRLEVRKSAADEREEGDEGVGGEAGEPAVESPPELGPLQQYQPAPPQHAFDPRGRLGSGNGRRERQPREPVYPILIEGAGIQEQPAAPAAHEGMDADV